MTMVETATHAAKLRVRFVRADDGERLAVYELGEPIRGTVLALHGFGSSALHTWSATQWLQILADAGLRVIAIDLRGHGKSGKPLDARAYSLAQIQRDAIVVIDALGIGEIDLLGYSMGARVAWELMRADPTRFRRGVLGGMSSARPLERLSADDAERMVLSTNADGVTVAEPPNRDPGATNSMSGQYSALLNRKGNVPEALIALIRGLEHDHDVDLRQAPKQPMFFAAGEFDGLLNDTRVLAAASGTQDVLVLPHRNHVNAPGAPLFKAEGTKFLVSDVC